MKKTVAIISKKKSSTKIKNPETLKIVAIGASAGGLEAITELLQNISPDTGMVFIYVPHLSPEHKSLLTSLLAKATKMKVLEVTDKILMKPDNFYIIPPDKEMTVLDGHIQLTARTKERVVHLPIDTFFSSLADVHKKNAIGVVLSGSASDGTRGLLAIKAAGGLTFAQNDSAKFSSMPQSAITAGAVDFVLSPKEIAKELIRISKYDYVKKDIINPVENEIENTNPDLKIILNLLLKQTQVDFSHYKMPTIKRRILRRMLLNKIKSLKDYALFTTKQKGEIDILYQDLLINVTNFFRDTDTHEYLKTSLFPKLLKSKTANEKLRIWIPACATGEEAYSIAMSLLEIQGEKATNIPIQIFATDLSTTAITKARIGDYTKPELEMVSPKRLQRFYTKTGSKYSIAKVVRDMVVFAPHNILRDPPFSRVDFISCCNLFIYLDTTAQKKALTTFHYALNEDGYLMLGKSETIGASGQLFTNINNKFKIYSRKKNKDGRMLPDVLPKTTQAMVNKKNNSISQAKNIPIKHIGFDGDIDAILLSRYVPASVVINHAMDILQFRGDTDLFLKHPTGKASLNILKMTAPEIAFELRHCIPIAIKTKQAIHKPGIEVKTTPGIKVISIEVIPLAIDWEEPLLLVLFTKPELVETFLQEGRNGKSNLLAKDRKIQKLEEELTASRADMHAFAQEQEAFIEELQSANEEVVSSNEELQSVNEELETSKEEIESTNEELTTTNQELQTRNELLNESYQYSDAILSNIQAPLLVLDKDLMVVSASQSFYKKFTITPEETEGLLLYDVGNKEWDIPALRLLLGDILPKNSEFHDFEVVHNFERLGEKIMMLNARRIYQKTHREQLILLSIEDYTERKKAQRKVEESEHRYHNMIYSSPFMIGIFKGEDMIIEMANDAILKSWGKNKDVFGKSVFSVIPEIILQGFDKILSDVYKTGTTFHAYEMPVTLLRHNREELIYYSFVYQPQRNVNGEIEGVAVIANEVTPQAVLNKKIKESEENFRQLAELIPQKISNADTAGNVFFYNQNWLNYTGLSIEALKDNGWEKIMHPDELKEITKRWQHSIKTGNNFEMEIRLLNNKGEYKWHLSRVSAVKDNKGKILKWLGAATEIQEQVEQREALENAVKERTNELSEVNGLLVDKNEELQKRNKELESFAYVSRHDLQEPLRKIQTLANRILETEPNLSEKGKDYFDRMQKSAERMQALIEDLLAFSSVHNIKGRKLVKTDLNVIIEEVKIQLSEVIKETKATVTAMPLCDVNIIPHQFRQVMLNLISNALKFTKSGTPPVITIKSSNVKQSKPNNISLPVLKEYCHIVIADNGIGFEAEYNEKIFEVFQRLHDKDDYPGTGIGLAIVKKIVENHHGIITAKGKLGKGAIFEIYIPA